MRVSRVIHDIQFIWVIRVIKLFGDYEDCQSVKKKSCLVYIE
jgi:hypothetical protein